MAKSVKPGRKAPPSARAELTRARDNRFIAWHPQEECYVNLAGNYAYLETPYYVSQDLEFERRPVYPTCKEMLDAYVAPLFLEKARLAGLGIPEYYITNGYFEPPVIVNTINPFMMRTRTVLRESRRESVAKSLTRNFTYAICCQEIPPDAAIKHFRVILGRTGSPRFSDAARAIWETFRIPVARVRVLLTADGSVLLSSIDPLPFKRLTAREVRWIREAVHWEK